MNQQPEFDVLLECLLKISTHFGQTINSEAILANLPVPDQGLTPKLLLSAASRAGFVAEFKKQDIDSLKGSQQASVVLLKNNRAAIYIPQTSGNEACFLIADQQGNFSKTNPVSIKNLTIGFHILLKPLADLSLIHI